MAMATALAGSSVSVVAQSVQKNSRVWGQNLQRVRVSASRTALKKQLTVSALKTQDTSPVVADDQLSQGASAIAGALFAAMATSDSAVAAQQVMALAANDDSRALALLIPLIPALGWVLFNILQPGLNQFNKMKSTKGLVAGLGLGALGSVAFSSEAEAAVQEITQIADNDSRGLVLLLILVPAIGWVLFNILQPALKQLNKMRSAKGLVGAVGLGGAASLLVANQADAAQEIAQLADNDSRGLVLLVVLLPAVGWVLFNILQPALNQLSKMRGAKGLAGAIGLSAAAASLVSAPDAEAAQEITQLAADNRPAILLVVLIPAIGWVLYNILLPALNQFNKMRGGK
jgi:photosystem II PsbY protein